MKAEVWEDSLVGKVLVKAYGPKLDPQDPGTKCGTLMCIVIPMEEWAQGYWEDKDIDPWGSLVNKPSMVGESQVPARDPASKKEREDSPEDRHSRLTSGLYKYTNIQALSRQR